MVEAEQERKARFREVRAHFLLPENAEETFEDLDAALVTLQPKYEGVIRAFRQSLVGAVSTVSMPFALANSSVQVSHYQRIYSAERMLALNIEEDALGPGADVEAARESEARTQAARRMAEFVQSEEGRRILANDICWFLVERLKDKLEQPARELLRQGLVLLWSAFEVLYRDTFETLLNEHPAKVRALMSDPTTRKRFEAQRLPLDTLVQHGFNLSARLGTALVAQQDFSDLPTIKAVYAVLFPGSIDLTGALAQRDLWKLYQRRHVVVRGGVIDQAYLDGTGEAQAIGTLLVLTPGDFRSALKAVVSAGAALARSL